MKQSTGTPHSPSLYKGQKVKVFIPPFREGRLRSPGQEYLATVEQIITKNSIVGNNQVTMVKVIHCDFGSPHVVDIRNIYPSGWKEGL